MASKSGNYTVTHRVPKSVPINLSIPNRGDNALYKRLKKYCDDKGLSEQEVIRYAISQLLERTGYK